MILGYLEVYALGSATLLFQQILSLHPTIELAMPESIHRFPVTTLVLLSQHPFAEFVEIFHFQGFVVIDLNDFEEGLPAESIVILDD